MGFRCDKWEPRHVAINPKHLTVGEAPLLGNLMSTCDPNCPSIAL